MNTPINPETWRDLQAYAAAQLPANFADGVLAAARSPQPRSRAFVFSENPLLLSAATVVLCVLSVVLFHSNATHSATEQHLAAWQEISVQTASLDSSP